MPIEIRTLAAAETIELRQVILRPGLPRETAIFTGDEAQASRHFGAFCEGRLVGVATIHGAPAPARPSSEIAYQVRGMATVPEARRQGVGGALLAACVEAARRAEARWLWCNARTPAVPFYARHGFAIVGEVFDIPTAGPHVRMVRALAEK